jgi:hypothetical protein
MAAIELRWINGIEEESGLAGGMQDVDGTYGIYRYGVVCWPIHLVKLKRLGRGW